MSRSTFDRFLDSLTGWKGFLFVLVWALGLPAFIYFGIPWLWSAANWVLFGR